MRHPARLAALALSILLLASCQSPRRMIENGDYDVAIDFCTRKLKGKAKKKTEYVRGLERAFRKAQDRDLRAADHLIAEDRPENWEQVYEIHRAIRRRQNKISPLLPLQAKDGYQAKFTFVNIEQLERESREKAANYLYDCAEDLLRQARRGDRQAARDAYAKLQDLEARYFKNYRNSREMTNEALDLGTTHILFEVRNQSDQVLPRDFNDRVLSFSTDDLNSRWKQFHLQAASGATYDYRAQFNVRRVDVSPERVSERAYIDEKEIEDGWEYVLDERGNVKKDTAGNDIKTPRRVRIRANILEVYQFKSVRLAGTLEVFPGDRNERLDAQDFNTEVLFENYASTFQGDRRALSDASRQRIGNRPLPFPPTEEMLIQAAERLKPNLREALRNGRGVF